MARWDSGPGPFWRADSEGARGVLAAHAIPEERRQRRSIECCPEVGACWQREVAVTDGRLRCFDDRVEIPVTKAEIRVKLLNREVRQIGRQMQRDLRGERAAAHMRCDAYAPALVRCSDLLGFHDAAGVGGIRLQDVHCARFEQFPRAMPPVMALAGSDRYRRARGDCRPSPARRPDRSVLRRTGCRTLRSARTAGSTRRA